MQTELLAQLIEVTSVGVAQRALKDPIEIPRPGHVRPEQGSTTGAWGGSQDTPAAPSSAYSQAIGVLAGTSLGGAA